MAFFTFAFELLVGSFTFISWQKPKQGGRVRQHEVPYDKIYYLKKTHIHRHPQNQTSAFNVPQLLVLKNPSIAHAFK